MDRYFAPVLFSIVTLFAVWALVTALEPNKEVELLTYTTQTIERIDAEGVVIVPVIEGYEGPAVCLSDTVPVRGRLEVKSSEPVDVRGSVIWYQIPPGERFVTAQDLPATVQPGASDLVFENVIPPRVVETVLAHGEASQWQVRGLVEVLEPHALDTVWETARFWVVDC
jgi:hypothetical protein